MATKKLRCWVGWHRWVRHVNDEGQAYHRCADCEKFKDISDANTVRDTLGLGGGGPPGG